MGVSSEGASKTGKVDMGDIAAVASNPDLNQPEQRKICKRHACSTTPAAVNEKHMEVWLFKGTPMCSSDPLRKAKIQHSRELMCPIPELK